jgi:hypothetical protein
MFERTIEFCIQNVLQHTRRASPFVCRTCYWQVSIGLRGAKSTTDQIHLLRHILEKTRELGINDFHILVGFKTAYDSVRRNKLYEAVEELGIPHKLVNLTKTTMSNVKCKGKI